jgi:hypothetical protein
MQVVAEVRGKVVLRQEVVQVVQVVAELLKIVLIPQQIREQTTLAVVAVVVLGHRLVEAVVQV